MEQEILALFEKVLSRKVGFHDELIESDILDSIPGGRYGAGSAGRLRLHDPAD